MSTRNDRFNRQMLRRGVGTIPDDRCYGNSDRGVALERMFDKIDGTPGDYATQAERELFDEIQLLMWAVLLAAGGYERLVPTLLLIARYGSNRKASIDHLRRHLVGSRAAARKCYFRHRYLLGSMFIWTNKDRAFLVL